MARTVVLVLAIAFVLSACIPSVFPEGPTAAPIIDTPTVDMGLAATMVAATLNALPTTTLQTATFTLQPTVTDTSAATETLPPEQNATAPAAATATAPPSTTAPLDTTATETLHPRFFGTLPPALPYGKVRLINRAKAEVYVSLQCKTIDGYTTILEYPVFGKLDESAPAGKYNYVAWVGGRQFLGSFSLSKGEEISITFNKDKVTIK